MDADKAVTATFSLASTPVSYTLTTIISPTMAGTVTLDPHGGVYPEGTVVTMTAVAADGYTFAGWGRDLIGTRNPITLTMAQDREITANFNKIKFNVYLPLVSRQ
jgi:uncharacterized repeat protein (TIGR02543 family)